MANGRLFMVLNDEILISAPQGRVYAALNAPEVLRQAIPGCEELVSDGENSFAAKVTLKIGPVKARFSGTVLLETEGAPGRFSLSGQGNGGVAGFAKGGADVVLEDRGEETLLKYTAKVDIGGKIAQLGARLIQGTANKLARAFFANLSEILEAQKG